MKGRNFSENLFRSGHIYNEYYGKLNFENEMN